MKLSFRCPSCKTAFRADEKFVGRRARCPNAECGKAVVLNPESPALIPGPKPAAAAVPDGVAMSAQINRSASRKEIPETTQNLSTPAGSHSASGSAPAASDRRVKNAVRASRRAQPGSMGAFGPLVIGFLATSLLGGGALISYSYWRNFETHLSTVDSEIKLREGFSSTPARAASTAQSSPAASLPSTLALGAAQTTSAVSDEIQHRNAARQQTLENTILPFLNRHCLDCHNADEQEGGITVHDLTTVDQLLKNRKKWERVYRMINAGAMPPASYDPMPEQAARMAVVDALNEELYNFDCSLIHHAGRSTLHRLNRAEYNNTIRDLFGITMTPADEFPQDDVGEGFDNNGDVLSLPPLLMEKYLNAAEAVATAVIDTRDFSKGITESFEPARFTASLNGNVDDQGFYVLHTSGSVSVTHSAIADGKYRIRIEASQTQAGPDPSKMQLKVDGQPAKEFQVDGHRKPGWFEHEITLTKGNHSIAAEFTNDFYNEKAPERERDRNLGVRIIEVTGPEGAAPQWHDTHRRIVTSVPSDTVTVKAAASIVLRPLLYRGFRRPVTDAEVDRFASLVERTVNEHKETYEYGLFVAVQALLVSPDFLFRKEADPEEGQLERVLNEFEVASRLSYFLWSTMPDEQLFQLAEHKRLLDRTVLKEQIERMLRDEKALALGHNFAAQWLNLRNLTDVRPNPELFPDFDESLRSAMRQETSLLFSTIVREDRSIDEFLGADYTFVNERLAKHYNIGGVSGEQFVKVSLQGTNRSGVLTHGSILTLTSNPGRTSPVKRGKWILENILGEAPPPPPPGVPPLEDAAKDLKDLSLRERLELHRKDPGCASCHKTMDPLGMGLENFDAVGRWRDKEGERPVDASGDLPTGEKFVGPSELVSIIRSRQEKFARTLTERLMVYALGRGLEYYDKCAVDQTIQLMKQRGNRFSALVEGIVTSDAFLKKSRSRDPDSTATQ